MDVRRRRSGQALLDSTWSPPTRPWLTTRAACSRTGCGATSCSTACGLARWQAPARREQQEQDYARELWRWLQAVTAQRERGHELYLGYGRDDHMADTGALLAAALPDDRVFITDSGHKWRTWRQLFRTFLERGPLRERCG